MRSSHTFSIVTGSLRVTPTYEEVGNQAQPKILLFGQAIY
jgi:hypothetical protein